MTKALSQAQFRVCLLDTSSKVESINLIMKISAFEFVTFIVFGLGWPGLKKITIRENQVPCFLTQMACNIRCTLLEDA